MKPIIQKLGMIVAMLLSFLPASAYDFEVDGIYYNILSITKLTCEVTSPKNGKYAGDIIIPSLITFNGRTIKVTAIGESAFNGCESLTSVEIPNSVTVIGKGAFNGCKSLASVEIPDSVTKLSDSLFEDCTALTSVNIPSSVTEIGASSFYGCSNLVELILHSTVNSIGNYAFARCTSIKSFVIPNTIKEIYSHTFRGCSNLESIVFPDSLSYVGKFAFESCKKLKLIEFPKTAITIDIEESAFEGCENIHSLYVPRSATLGKRAFAKCTGLQDLTINSNEFDVRGDIASFYNCNNISKLKIAGGYASGNLYLDFYNYNVPEPFYQLKLEELYLDRQVIYYSQSFPVLKWPSKRVTFGPNFRGKKDIKSHYFWMNFNAIPLTTDIYCESLVPPSFGTEFTNKQYISNTVYVPREALEAYQNAPGWKNFWNLKGYDPTSGIEDIEMNQDSDKFFRVYNMQGVLVKTTTDRSEINNLPRGLYIVNGKKVFVR